MDRGPAVLAGLVLALSCLSAAPLFTKTYVNFGSLALDFTCGPERSAAACVGTVSAAASPFLLAALGVTLCLLLAGRGRRGLCLVAGAGTLAAAWVVALCFVLTA